MKFSQLKKLMVLILLANQTIKSMEMQADPFEEYLQIQESQKHFPYSLSIAEKNKNLSLDQRKLKYLIKDNFKQLSYSELKFTRSNDDIKKLANKWAWDRESDKNQNNMLLVNCCDIDPKIIKSILQSPHLALIDGKLIQLQTHPIYYQSFEFTPEKQTKLIMSDLKLLDEKIQEFRKLGKNCESCLILQEFLKDQLTKFTKPISDLQSTLSQTLETPVMPETTDQKLTRLFNELTSNPETFTYEKFTELFNVLNSKARTIGANTQLIDLLKPKAEKFIEYIDKSKKSFNVDEQARAEKYIRITEQTFML